MLIPSPGLMFYITTSTQIASLGDDVLQPGDDVHNQHGNSNAETEPGDDVLQPGDDVHNQHGNSNAATKPGDDIHKQHGNSNAETKPGDDVLQPGDDVHKQHGNSYAETAKEPISNPFQSLFVDKFKLQRFASCNAYHVNFIYT